MFGERLAGKSPREMTRVRFRAFSLRPILPILPVFFALALGPRPTVPPETLFHQEPSKAAHVAQRRGAFERPDVKVHPAARHSRLFDEIEHGALAEPDRWAHHACPPEY